MSSLADPAILASAYGQLLGLLVEAPEIDAVLEKMVALAAEVVTPAVACGLTVRRDGQPFTAAMSNELAARIDQILRQRSGSLPRRVTSWGCGPG